jgi:hypothetical protein
MEPCFVHLTVGGLPFLEGVKTYTPPDGHFGSFLSTWFSPGAAICASDVGHCSVSAYHVSMAASNVLRLDLHVLSAESALKFCELLVFESISIGAVL